MGCIQSGHAIVVDGRTYRVVENIGEGGFSQVDLCRDEKSGSLCVAKRVLCHARTDVDKALREAATHARLPRGHPNLLPCLGHAVNQPPSGAAQCIAEVTLLLPYHKRGTLAEELDLRRIAKSCLGLPRILATMAGLCSGLSAIHATDLAHRDLKTGNVLLADEGEDSPVRPVIMDFGSATEKLVWINSRQEATKWQDYAAEHCSMTYRAPELFNVPWPCVISEKADIWSLGCILYAMCFNESPFDQVYSRGDSVALAACSGIKVPATNSNYPEALLQLIRDMGEPEPDRRPSLAECQQVLTPLMLAAGVELPTSPFSAEAVASGDNKASDSVPIVSRSDVRLEALNSHNSQQAAI